MKALRSHFSGVALCIATALFALVLERAETAAVGRPWLEALVLAILCGTLVRTLWHPSVRFQGGIRFAAHTLLEIAVALMGATVSISVIAAAGLPLIFGIVATVAGAILASFLLGRAAGLPAKMATLIACGNAICGNSAIAAVAPAIDADSDDVATAVAFTAVLSVVVVVMLPLVAAQLHLTPIAGGALAGLTVYAVPQVLAAAAPMGPAAIQIGTLVKLVRVLMLGPVVACLSLVKARRGENRQERRFGITHFLPPFILTFLGLMLARSAGVLPDPAVRFAHGASSLLTVIAMAGLGLGVDLRSVAAAGPKVIGVVTLSLLLLGLLALAVLKLSGIGSL